MADEDLKAELERLKAENEPQKQQKRVGSNSIKVSDKGAVSVYGLGRFPMTLYGAMGEVEVAFDGRRDFGSGSSSPGKSSAACSVVNSWPF
jgi:hypothetical protein